MDEDTARYREYEFGKVLGDDDLMIKITGDIDPNNGLAGTRWMNITREELGQIAAILTGKRN